MRTFLASAVNFCAAPDRDGGLWIGVVSRSTWLRLSIRNPFRRRAGRYCHRWLALEHTDLSQSHRPSTICCEQPGCRAEKHQTHGGNARGLRSHTAPPPPRRHDALRKLADCPCTSCGHVDMPAIREDRWRRNADDALPPMPATTDPPFSMTTGQGSIGG